MAEIEDKNKIRKIRDEVLKKWDSLGFLDGIKGIITDEKILSLYRCCKSTILNEGKMEKNEIKKDLYKSKNMATFSHYVSGNLYYKVELSVGIYQFPIRMVEKKYVMDTREIEKIPTLILAEDLGTTTFNAEIKGSELIRWIEKAIDNEDFIKVG